MLLNIVSDKDSPKAKPVKINRKVRKLKTPAADGSAPKKWRTTNTKEEEEEEELINTKPQKRNLEHNEAPKPKKHIVSIFKHNPEIPNIDLKYVKPKEERLFSSDDFSSLPLHSHLVACLRDRLKLCRMTSVQSQAIPVLLNCEDALVKSLTGSGKTLVYSVPIVQNLQAIKPPLTRKDGVRALIVVPSRELAIQSYEYFQTLCRAFTWIVPGCLMGGEKKKSEKARIRKGLSILVGTPGRLLDHLQNTANLDLSQLQWLVIDEADRLLELGFERSISEIVEQIQRQQASSITRTTVLLSATLTKDVERLAGLTLQHPHLIDLAATEFCEVLTTEEFALPAELTQRFIICPLKLRLSVLTAHLIDQNLTKCYKTIIFMAAQDVVDFHHLIFVEVLKRLVPHLEFFRLHGNMDQKDRVKVFKEFREVSAGVLLCTDVACRGLDVPLVEEIVQFSVPSCLEDYVHRAGRTARAGSRGRSLLFLLPSETPFLEELHKHAINLQELNLNDVLPTLKVLGEKLAKRRQPHTVEEHATALQDIYEHEVESSQELMDFARKGFTAYTRAYASYPRSLRHAVPFHGLHLGHAAKSFCLQETPSELAARFKSASTRFNHWNQKRQEKPPRFSKPGFERDARKISPMKPTKTSVSRRPGAVQVRQTKVPFRMMSEYDSGL